LVVVCERITAVEEEGRRAAEASALRGLRRVDHLQIHLHVAATPFITENRARGLPDVAYTADLFGSLIIAFGGRFGRVGGTSVGAPQWAGIDVLSDQMAGHRLPPLNVRLYHIAKSHAYVSAFHDIASGNNSFAGVVGFSATTSWDPVTGLGTPDVAKLLPLLSQTTTG